MNGSKNVLSRGIHGLATAYDSGDAQILEHRSKAFTSSNSYKAVLLFGIHSGVNKFAGRGLFLSSLLLFQTLALLLAGEKLLMHVLNLKVSQITILDGLRQNFAWVSSVNMAVSHVIVFNHNHAVAIGLKESAQFCNRNISIVFVDKELGAVTVFDVFYTHQVISKNTLACSIRVELCLVLGQLFTLNGFAALENNLHTLKNNHQTLPACIHNTGLFQDRQLVGSIV
ncbi:hypothetical protein EVA_11702 [gut metagenome]|uniref:Uncharacterized protein n=1 Tax=gut metagenome TaxID=749906 RepID=J9FYY8_9ZZZZ